MTKKLLFIFLILIFLSHSTDANTEKLTAADWSKITRQRKIYFVLGSMEMFQQKKIVFRHTMDEYIKWMDDEASKEGSGRDMNLVFSGLVAAKEHHSLASR